MRPRIAGAAHIPFGMLDDLHPFGAGWHHVTRPFDSLDAVLIHYFVQDWLVMVFQMHLGLPSATDQIPILLYDAVNSIGVRLSRNLATTYHINR